MKITHYIWPRVYIALKPDILSVRDVCSGLQVKGEPIVAISKNPPKSVLAVGESARAAAAQQSAEVINPFKHPRSLLSDFTIAEIIIKSFLKKLFPNRLIKPAPVIVMHPLVDPEGGFTQIEIRALADLALGAGASKAYVMTGQQVLRDDELCNLDLDILAQKPR